MHVLRKHIQPTYIFSQIDLTFVCSPLADQTHSNTFIIFHLLIKFSIFIYYVKILMMYFLNVELKMFIQP